MITEYKLRQEYAAYRDKALAEYHRGHIESCLDVMNLACVLCRHYYLQWTERAFEDILEQLAKEMREDSFAVFDNRIVFYDVHATDTYVLTQQYLSALLSWGKELLFVTTKDLTEPNRKLIKRQLDESPQASICEVPKGLTRMETAKFIADAVRAFAPSKAFVQADSYDVAGIIAFGSLPDVESYYIETSDHIFWLGTREFDHYISFRSLGYNVCVQHRHIPSEKVLLQPYYPVSASKPYKGLPEARPGDVKVLSGARLEKLYGMGDKYFELVEGVIKQNPNVQFYFVGAGVYGKSAQTAYLDRQISKRGISDRFHRLGFRDDITALMRHVDIYMGTYPIGGGLMTQLAVDAGLPIVQYVSPGLSDCVGEFVDCTDRDQPFVFVNDQEGFYQEMRSLVADSRLRASRAAANSEKLLREEGFIDQLTHLVATGENAYVPSIYPTDCSANRANQLEVENDCTHDHSRILVKSSYVRTHQPVKYLGCVLDFLARVDKKWLVDKLSQALSSKLGSMK